MPEPQNPQFASASLEQWRTSFASERTLLSWTRTANALMGLGFILARFGLFLRQFGTLRREVPDDGQAPLWLGMTLVLMGTVILAAAARRYHKTQKQIAPGTELATATASRTPILLSGGLAVFGVALTIYLFQLRQTDPLPSPQKPSSQPSQNTPVE